MPATIKDIAAQCGCSKQTVRNNLKALGLWDGHVREPQGRGGAVIVDDEACSAVCDKIMRRKVIAASPAEELGGTVPESREPVLEEHDQQVDLAIVRELYEARISDLKDQIAGLRSQVDVLQSTTEEYRQEARDLRRAMADHAKELPAAREEARREGAEAERDRIRSLGVLARLFGSF